MPDRETQAPTEITRHALVIRVPRNVENRIEDLYLNVAGTTKPVMGYHITVLGPFLLAEDAPGLDLSRIEGVCRAQEPFSVALGGLHVSAEPNSNAILVDIAHPQDIIALHDALLAALEDQIVFSSDRARQWNLKRFHPHVTVALGLSDKELAGFPVEHSSQQCHASFQVTSVSLAADRPYEPWRHLRSFALGGSCQSTCQEIDRSQTSSALDSASYS